jgi:hypothetical protein
MTELHSEKEKEFQKHLKRVKHDDHNHKFNNFIARVEALANEV